LIQLSIQMKKPTICMYSYQQGNLHREHIESSLNLVFNHVFLLYIQVS
jgi:hypothetical protein